MPITPADEQRLQAVFEWAKRLFRRKGLTEHDAEDCAAEVRLQMLAHLQQGRTFSFAYAVQVARGVLADFISAQQQHHPTIPLENADWHGGGVGRAVSGAAGSSPLGVGATTP
jgi:DNA-directed RNA polymerase specialized sigma24 family protein